MTSAAGSTSRARRAALIPASLPPTVTMCMTASVWLRPVRAGRPSAAGARCRLAAVAAVRLRPVGEDDVGGFGWRDRGIQRPDDRHAGDRPPRICAAIKGGTEDGAIPAKVSENIRPMVIAGLAKLVEEVKKYAAPM